MNSSRQYIAEEALKGFRMALQEDAQYSVHTKAAYLRRVEHWLKYWVTEERSGFERPDLTTYFRHLESSGVPGSTITQTASALRLFLTQVRGKQPKGIPLLKFRPTQIGPILTSPEMKRLIHTSSSAEDRAILALLGLCGLKLYEVRRVTVDDVTPDTAELASFRSAGEGAPVSPDALSHLLWHKTENRPVRWLIEGRLPGSPLSGRSIQLRVKAAGDALGMHLTPDALRDSFAVSQLRRGYRPAVVAAMMGFRSVRSIVPHLRAAQIRAGG